VGRIAAGAARQQEEKQGEGSAVAWHGWVWATRIGKLAQARYPAAPMVFLRTSLALALGLAAAAAAPRAEAQELAFTKSKLKNDLTVILHEDHTLPQVAVNLVYRVGSRDEEAKRTGFAHLFEHLMFMGTTRVPPKMFDAWMEAAGGSNNAWTSSDLTDYHEVGPATSLSLLLWLEADRIATLGREIDAGEAERCSARSCATSGGRPARTPPTARSSCGSRAALPRGAPLPPPGHRLARGPGGRRRSPTCVSSLSFYVPRTTLPRRRRRLQARRGGAGRALLRLDPRRAAARPQGGLRPPPLGKVVRETIEDHVELPKIILALTTRPRASPRATPSSTC
jgi:zinc protease